MRSEEMSITEKRRELQGNGKRNGKRKRENTFIRDDKKLQTEWRDMRSEGMSITAKRERTTGKRQEKREPNLFFKNNKKKSDFCKWFLTTREETYFSFKTNETNNKLLKPFLNLGLAKGVSGTHAFVCIRKNKCK